MEAMRVAIITGAAQGIGRATAEALAAEGYVLLLLDLHYVLFVQLVLILTLLVYLYVINVDKVLINPILIVQLV